MKRVIWGNYSWLLVVAICEMCVSINLSQPAIWVLGPPVDPPAHCVEVLFFILLTFMFAFPFTISDLKP